MKHFNILKTQNLRFYRHFWGYYNKQVFKIICLSTQFLGGQNFVFHVKHLQHFACFSVYLFLNKFTR